MPEYNRESREKSVWAVAEERGLEVVEPADTDIFLDIDRLDDLAVVDAQLKVFADNGFHFEKYKVTRSVNDHWHVYVRAPWALTELERLFLQAVLGSDRKRELLGFVRNIDGDKPVGVLFEVPGREPEWQNAHDDNEVPF